MTPTQMLNDPITIAGVAISSMVAVWVFVVALRCWRERLGAALAILSIGAFGALVFAAYLDLISGIGGRGSSLGILAGAVCGFS